MYLKRTDLINAIWCKFQIYSQITSVCPTHKWFNFPYKIKSWHTKYIPPWFVKAIELHAYNSCDKWSVEHRVWQSLGNGYWELKVEISRQMQNFTELGWNWKYICWAPFSLSSQSLFLIKEKIKTMKRNAVTKRCFTRCDTRSQNSSHFGLSRHVFH